MESVKEIGRMMKKGEYEPEVALAVRIPGVLKEGEDNGEDMDSMLLSCGFEYVDGTRVSERTRVGEDDDGRGMEDGKEKLICF